jgi:NAD-dependent histone deacetylase SIR2
MKPLQTQIPLEPKAPWPTTIQLHGSLDKMVCTKCADIQPFKGDIFDGPEAPLCESCKNLDEVRTAHAGKRSHGIGRLRPRFVLYNEFNPDEDAIGNVMRADLRARPDAVLVVGTTLKVPGTRRLVKQLCQVARGRKDGLTAWINIDSEPKVPEFKDCWDLVVKSKCDNIARLVALPPWDCEIGDDYLVSKEDEQERLSTVPSKIEVRLDGKSAPVEEPQAIPTPRASPPPSDQHSRRKPLPVAKQSKLSFGATRSVPVKSGKIAKSGARKPKQAPKKQPPPSNALLQTFKASKKASEVESGKKIGTRSPLPNGQPLKEEPSVDVSLPSPRQEVKTPERMNFADSSAASPPTDTIPDHRLQDTISPKSVPKNMRNLIDVA